MAAPDKTQIIRAFFAAYMSNNRRAVEDALTDDFRFSSPYDDEIDKTMYFARCWRNTAPCISPAATAGLPSTREWSKASPCSAGCS